MTKDEALKLALDDLMVEYDMERTSFAKRVDEIFKQALAAPVQPVQEPVAWVDSVMEQAQVFASAWSLVGGRFDSGNGLEEAKQAKAELRAMLATPPAAPVQPVAMRMPKVGDRVVCIDDESLGTVVYLTAGGSPEIKFDDGSHGTYMLREFAELFGYTTPAAQRQWVGLTDEQISAIGSKIFPSTWNTRHVEFARAIEAKLKELNT